MGKTMQGAFDMAYHHIDAPTVQDDEWGKEHKSRKLCVPDASNSNLEIYRSKLIAYLSDNLWSYTRKIDGANLRVQWNGEQALWNGKSNNFCCGSQLTEYMNKTFIEEIFEEKFGRDKIVTLFGEHMGPKVQGNELGLKKDEFILYDVNIDGTWLEEEDVIEIAKYFGLRTVHDFMEGGFGQPASLAFLIERVERGDFKDWEGIVATPLAECRDQKGGRVIVKVKNKDYLRTEGGKNDER